MLASPRATLIGDVVASRQTADRSALHRRLTKGLAVVASTATDPPAFTVGDEFQGSYPSVGAAIAAALEIRLGVGPDIDVRFGIGWGDVTILDPSTGIQDGPGWWAAREAIEWTCHRTAAARTCPRPHRLPQRGRRRTGRQRRQRRPVVSGPPAWIGRCTIPAAAAGSARPQDEEGIGGNGRHQRVGGVTAHGARRAGSAGVGLPNNCGASDDEASRTA